MESKRAKELAEAHWNGYVRPLVKLHSADGLMYGLDEVLELCGWHYTTALQHGHRHGVEDERNGLFRPRIGHHPPAHPYYHKDDLPLSPEEVKAINDSISPPSRCGTCIRQGCPVDCAEHTTECVNYLAPKEGVAGVEKAEFSFSFPAAEKYIGKSSVDYINKLREEIREVETTNTMEDYAIELMDVIHVAETALRSLERETGWNLQDMADHVVAKNRQRNYYTKD